VTRSRRAGVDLSAGETLALLSAFVSLELPTVVAADLVLEVAAGSDALASAGIVPRPGDQVVRVSERFGSIFGPSGRYA
jgi:hypothetical protein